MSRSVLVYPRMSGYHIGHGKGHDLFIAAAAGMLTFAAPLRAVSCTEPGILQGSNSGSDSCPQVHGQYQQAAGHGTECADSGK